MRSSKIYFCAILFALCLVSFAGLMAEGSSPSLVLTLQGHLSKDEIDKAEKKLSSFDQKNSPPIILEINSNSGDLEQTLSLVKALYITKLKSKNHITAYIDDKAIGPSALLPFVADDLEVSPIATWGDISFGNEDLIPANILRSRVESLLPEGTGRSETLKTLAAGMSDKNASSKELKALGKVDGEALVINQQQLKALKLITQPISEEQFREKMQIEKGPLLAPLTPSKSSQHADFSKGTLQALKEHIRYNSEGSNQIGHLIIEDHSSSITQATWLYIKKGLDYYKKTKPLFVILELNTPGGEVFAAQKISDALKEFDTQYNIPIVCYINNWAISAGAMLAYSCRFIAVTKDATMGAAEPVIMGEDNQMAPVSEKINSALRTDFASRARFFDRNPYIAEAMVDKDLIVIVRHGEVMTVDNESQIRSTGPNPDVVLSPKGKLLTLNAEQLITYNVADILLYPQKTGTVTEQELESGKWPASKLLLFHAPFFDEIPDATIDAYKMDWKSRFFAFLASPMISSLLLLGMLLGFYVELSTPGFGLPGAIGVLSLILIILSSFALEIANWLELIFLLLGLAILLIDIFLLPTFGLLGFAGLLFFVAGLTGLLLPGLSSIEYESASNTFNAAGEMVMERLTWFGMTLLIGIGLILLLARYITPSLARYSSLVLSGGEQDASKGYIAGEDPKLLPQPGAHGEVLATLRPAGKVTIDGKIYEAISGGTFIEQGEKIVVTGLADNIIIVDTWPGRANDISEV